LQGKNISNLISLDEKTRYIMDAIYQEKEFEDDEDMKLKE
jgi:hypothetical protein